MLLVQLPVGFGDGSGAQQAIRGRLSGELGSIAPQLLAVDSAIDNDVRDVHAARAVLAGDTLRDRAQSRFGGGKRDERAAALGATRWRR